MNQLFSNSFKISLDDEESSNGDVNLEVCDIPFEKEKHIKFLKYSFFNLKKHHSLETHKMTMLYFIVAGLKILNSLSELEKEYSVAYVINNSILFNNKIKGFRGGTFSGWSNNKKYKEWNSQDIPHIAATYCALSILKMCDNNIETNDGSYTLTMKFREILENQEIVFNEEEIINTILFCQNDNGQIKAQSWDTENDVRFFYCAMAIFKLFGKNSEEIQKLINLEESKKFLLSLKNFEGGYSMIDEGESNAGTTFTAISSYIILGLDIPDKHILIDWLCNRNSILGVNGRTNKIPDSCYSFWVMATLFNLKLLDLFDKDHTINFLLNCQSCKGGFTKHLNFDGTSSPDLLHTFYSLSSLALLNYEGLYKNTINFKINLDPLIAIPL